MSGTGRAAFALAVGLLLAVGVPHFGATVAGADPGCGGKGACNCGKAHDCRHEAAGCPCGADPCAGQPCPKTGCEERHPKNAGQAGSNAPCPDHEAMHGKNGGHSHAHGGPPAGGPPMKTAMGKHLEEMRQKIAALRALEGKMEAQKSKDDAAAFRAASLEHSRLLTDLQESHLKHMEGMLGK